MHRDRTVTYTIVYIHFAALPNEHNHIMTQNCCLLTVVSRVIYDISCLEDMFLVGYRSHVVGTQFVLKLIILAGS